MYPLVSTDPRQIGGFRLGGVLGRGGQGTVYLGQNASRGQVAVKVLNAHQVAGDQDARRRFEREAEAARRVAPFCTARVLDAGIADGRPYIVSEFITGPSLDVLVGREGVRSGSGIERLAVATLTALAAIHRAGIVHRDFKPANVIMGAEGPVVIDFGIARALDQTATSSVIGTPAFMAPEQFEGGAVGPEVDLFSWAGTMVFAATGRHAFAGDTTPAVMRAILDAEPDLTGVAPTLLPVLEKCLVKDPRRRPSAEEVLRWLTGERSPFSDDGQATTLPVQGARPTFEPPGTRVLDPTARPRESAAPGGNRSPSLVLALAAPIMMGAALVLGLLSLTVDNIVLANLGLGGLLLSCPILGLAVWRYHVGALIALCSMFPSGLVFVFWGAEARGFPGVLIAYIPIGLLGVALALTATFLRSLGKTAMVLGMVAGASFVQFATIGSLTRAFDFGGGVFVFSRGVSAVGGISYLGWLVLLCTALVRRALQSRRGVP